MHEVLALLSTATFDALAQAEDWDAAGHASNGSLLAYAGQLGTLVLVSILVVLLVRAWLRRDRYRATGVLSADDLEALNERIRETEKRTVGEVVPVVLERSDDHPGARWVAAVAFVIAGCAALGTVLPWDRPLVLLALQFAFGAVGYLAARALPDFQRIFVREARATEMAEEQAFQEFYRLGLHRTEAQTGVLLFLSLFERRVIVLGDEGIDRVVDAGQWERTSAAILERVAAGELRDGLLAGIASVGDVLTERFPWKEGDRNELPDRVVVRRS